MDTIKETQNLIDKNQMLQYIKLLIKQINENTDNKPTLTLIEEETEPPWFEISVEYPHYIGQVNSPRFQRRISINEAEQIAQNVFYNIKDLFGEEYKEKFCYVKPRSEGQQYSDGRRDYFELGRAEAKKEVRHKKICIRILFAV